MKKLHDIFYARTGAIAIEFALTLPVFIVLALPVVDYGRYILMYQKLVKTASFISDAVSMSTPIKTDTTQALVDADGLYLTQPAIASIVNTLDTLMIPFPPEQGGQERYQAVVTQVYRDPSSGAPVMGWQYDQNSGSFYDSARQSEVGVIASPADAGVIANIPAALANDMAEGENLIVAEVSARFEPITPNLLSLGIPYLQPRTISYTAYFRARYGDLSCVWPSKPPAPCPPQP